MTELTEASANRTCASRPRQGAVGSVTTTDSDGSSTAVWRRLWPLAGLALALLLNAAFFRRARRVLGAF